MQKGRNPQVAGWVVAPAVGLITLYQKTLSPDHGLLKPFFPHGYCPYVPTCSEYAKQAYLTYGFIKGSLRAGYRVLRCHPWTQGGIDHP